jgi:hypothetical protein
MVAKGNNPDRLQVATNRDKANSPAPKEADLPLVAVVEVVAVVTSLLPSTIFFASFQVILETSLLLLAEASTTGPSGSVRSRNSWISRIFASDFLKLAKKRNVSGRSFDGTGRSQSGASSMMASLLPSTTLVLG